MEFRDLLERSDMKVIVKKAEKQLDKMGIVYQYVKGIDKDSYEIALSDAKDSKKLKAHFDDMLLPINYEISEDVFFLIKLGK